MQILNIWKHEETFEKNNQEYLTCIFFYCLSSRWRIFHSYRDFNIVGAKFKSLLGWGREGSFTCRDMGLLASYNSRSYRRAITAQILTGDYVPFKNLIQFVTHMEMSPLSVILIYTRRSLPLIRGFLRMLCVL